MRVRPFADGYNPPGTRPHRLNPSFRCTAPRLRTPFNFLLDSGRSTYTTTALSHHNLNLFFIPSIPGWFKDAAGNREEQNRSPLARASTEIAHHHHVGFCLPPGKRELLPVMRPRKSKYLAACEFGQLDQLSTSKRLLPDIRRVVPSEQECHRLAVRGELLIPHAI